MTVKFFRGPYASYNQATHGSGIYFATDKCVIRMDGRDYNGDLSNPEKFVSNVELDSNNLKITYLNGSTEILNLVEVLPTATTESKGLLSAEDKGFIDKLSADVKVGNRFLLLEEAETIASVKAGDYENKLETVSGNILSVNGKDITATVSISYDKTNQKIKLLGKNDTELGSIDASAFIKDGMLTDVDLVENPEGKTGTFLRFQWNTDSNLDSVTTDLDVTKLIDVYVAGNGVAIDGKTIKAKVAPNDAYLEVTNEGIRSKGIDDAIISAKNTLIGTTDDASSLSTIYGAKKYADEKVAEVNKSLESYKVLDVVEFPSYNAIKLTNTNSKLDISVNLSDIGNDLVSASHVSGTNIKVNKSVLGSQTSTSISDVLTLLETDTIKSVKSVTGDYYLTPVISTVDSVTSLQLSLNTSKLISDTVDTDSALSVKDGKITIE